MRNVKLLWGLTVCLAATVLVMGLLLVRESGEDPEEGQEGGLGEDRVIATIGDRQFKLSMLEEQLLQKHGRELLNQLLDREALRLEGEEQGVKITREEVDAELKTMQQGYDSEGQFYDSMLTQLGMTREDIREDVYYKLIMERIATKAVRVSDSEISKYISDHPEEFGLVSQLRIQKIVNQTKDQAKRTMELAKSGKDFGMLAKERSLDVNSAQDGGDLGWVEDNDPFITPDLLAAARKLKVGEVAGPIQTDEGFIVIRLKDKKEQSKGSPEQIRENVRRMLALQKAPPMQEIVQSLRSKFNAVIVDSALAESASS